MMPTMDDDRRDPDHSDDLEGVLDAVGPRLRALRRQRRITLAELAATTGISESTLSRLEGGRRRANLELLLPWPAPTASRWTTSWARRPPVTPGSTSSRFTGTA